MDPITIASLIQAGGSLISGGIDYFGQKNTNTANAKMAKDQMDFQERMSNTSWQRSVADMKKAGINPMLLVSKGVGASSPTGASSVSQNPTSSIARGITSAADAFRLKAELQNLQADTKLKSANADTMNAQLPATSARAQFDASKYGAANDAIAIIKKNVNYDGSVANAKSGSSKGFSISKAMGDFQNYLHDYARKHYGSKN